MSKSRTKIVDIAKFIRVYNLHSSEGYAVVGRKLGLTGKEVAKIAWLIRREEKVAGISESILNPCGLSGRIRQFVACKPRKKGKDYGRDG